MSWLVFFAASPSAWSDTSLSTSMLVLDVTTVFPFLHPTKTDCASTQYYTPHNDWPCKYTVLYTNLCTSHIPPSMVTDTSLPASMLVPLITTVVPPDLGPFFGMIPVTTGSCKQTQQKKPLYSVPVAGGWEQTLEDKSDSMQCNIFSNNSKTGNL